MVFAVIVVVAAFRKVSEFEKHWLCRTMSQPVEKRQKVEHLHDVRCADGTIQISTHDIERLVSDVGGNLQVVHLMKRSALESIISEYNKNPTVTITCVDGEVISMLLTEKNKLVDSVGGSASVLSGMKKSIVEVIYITDVSICGKDIF